MQGTSVTLTNKTGRGAINVRYGSAPDDSNKDDWKALLLTETGDFPADYYYIIQCPLDPPPVGANRTINPLETAKAQLTAGKYEVILEGDQVKLKKA